MTNKERNILSRLASDGEYKWHPIEIGKHFIETILNGRRYQTFKRFELRWVPVDKLKWHSFMYDGNGRFLHDYNIIYLLQKGYIEYRNIPANTIIGITKAGRDVLKETKGPNMVAHRDRQIRKDHNVKGQKEFKRYW